MFCKNGDLWISRKYCSAQDLADFEKVSSAIGVNGTMTGSRGLGIKSSKVFFDKRRSDPTTISKA